MFVCFVSSFLSPPETASVIFFEEKLNIPVSVEHVKLCPKDFCPALQLYDLLSASLLCIKS